MYGLVNQAIEDMILSQFGQATWAEIKQKAQVAIPAFESMHSYPDTITYDLVGVASQVLQMPPEQILESFGEYWVLYTAESGYGDMLSMAGHDFTSFLQNLDTLHSIVGSMMPHLQPPSFKCTDITSNQLVLHYYSQRKGLTPMVVGLVRGLGKRFGTDCKVKHISSETDHNVHEVFEVKW
jgi:hypothetical protein